MLRRRVIERRGASVVQRRLVRHVGVQRWSRCVHVDVFGRGKDWRKTTLQMCSVVKCVERRGCAGAGVMDFIFLMVMCRRLQK